MSRVISNPLGSQAGDIPLGGAGSGNWGHRGRPGKRGGSAPGGPRMQVGITSEQAGNPAFTQKMILAAKDELTGNLAETPIKGLSCEVGRGGWKGGHETTYVTSYTGNGEALRELAEFGKKYDQDGVLVQKYTSPSDPKAQPQNRVTIKGQLDNAEIESLERTVADAGFEGWTWYSKGGRTSLMLTCIPQWGGEKGAHLQSVQRLSKMFEAAGIEFELETHWVDVDLMTPDTYDKYIN